jgi:DNA-binding response OmpR family regulator
VLVVEDEPAIRQIITDVLTDEGYTIRTAADGLLALSELERTGEGIDLVLSDVGLPRLNGIALVQQVRQRHPTVRMALMSAFLLLPALPGVLVLRKPFSLEHLERFVAHALTHRTPWRPEAGPDDPQHGG